MISFNPLANILTQNKLEGPHYVDWKRNLDILLRSRNGLKAMRWRDVTFWHLCQMFCNIRSENGSTYDILENLKEMFGDQTRRNSSKNSILKMMSLLNDMEVLGLKLTRLLRLRCSSETIIKQGAAPVVLNIEKKMLPNNNGAAKGVNGVVKKPKGKCFHCKQPGHWKLQCPTWLAKKKQGTSPFHLLVVETCLAVLTTHQWCVDSGATNHVCNSFKGEVNIFLGDGTEVAVLAVGNIALNFKNNRTLILKNVLYVPSIRRNLISVSSLITPELQLTNSEVNNFDIVAPLKRKRPIELSYTYLWHLRLGHINLDRISLLVKDGPLSSLKVEALPTCESCLEGKMTKRPFPLKGNRASDVLELIHSDLCGPMSVQARGGFEYFVTFTDDYSRYGYIYLLRRKSECFEKFKAFKAETEKRHGKYIKTLRSDRGGEYISREFINFLSEQGITSQLSALVGLSTLMEMVRSMMSYSDLPISLWRHAIETKIHSNLVPSKSDLRLLQNQHEPEPFMVGADIPLPQRSGRNVSGPEFETSDISLPVGDEENVEAPVHVPFEEHIDEVQDVVPPVIDLPALQPQQDEGVAEQPVVLRRSGRTRRPPVRYTLLGEAFDESSRSEYRTKYVTMMHYKIKILLEFSYPLAYFDYEIWQMDVKTTFLNGSLDECIYMKQLEGFITNGQEHLLCKLNRSIYGLKQASRSWNTCFDQTIKTFGFDQCHDESCVYKKWNGKKVVFLVLYVDDILLIGNCIGMLTSVKDWLSQRFDMKDLGEVAHIRGSSLCEIARKG
ncbi:hypothetical protein AAG906_018907 [Vitis piasezkii]